MDVAKQHGNDLFSSGDFAGAEAAYSLALDLFEPGEESTRVACLSNRAACRLKLDNPAAALADADEVLREHPTHPKALYRRALALRALGRAEEALASAVRGVKAGGTAAVKKLARELAAAAPSDAEQLLRGVESGAEDAEKRLIGLGVPAQLLAADAPRRLAAAGALHALAWLAKDHPQTVAPLVDPEGAITPAYIGLCARVAAQRPELALRAVLGGLRATGAGGDEAQQAALEALVLAEPAEDAVRAFAAAGGLESLVALPAQLDDTQKVALGRLLSPLSEDAANELIERHVLRHLHVDAPRADLLAAARALAAVFTANPGVGQAALLADEARVPALITLATSRHPEAQHAAAAVFLHCASTEEGRAMLLTEALQETLDFLGQSPSGDVRSKAAVVAAKLQAKQVDPDVVPGVLAALADRAHAAEAVEGVSYIATHTAVKEAIATGAALGHLVDIARSDTEEELRPEVAFGLAHIFAALTTNNEDVRRQRLAEKDMTLEQYDQMQQLAQQHGQAPAAGSDDRDSAEAAMGRRLRFARADGIAAVVKLSAAGNDNVLKLCAQALCNVCTERGVRGLALQQGAMPRLLALCGHHDGETAARAAHAIAKVLITTNPALVPESQVHSAIGPMLRLVKADDDLLAQFEALMALTNVASLGPETVQAIVDRKGVATITFAQFSDDERIRRVATEALCNLAYHPAMREYTARGGRMRIWVALLEELDDPPTAMAAAGGLASLTGDEVGAGAFLGSGSAPDDADDGGPTVVRRAPVELEDGEGDGDGDGEGEDNSPCGVLARMFMAEDEGLLHRLAVVAANLMEFQPARARADFVAHNVHVGLGLVAARSQGPAREIAAGLLEGLLG